jgi:hypothetical protein
LHSHIFALPITLNNAHPGEFDVKGTELWNLSTRLNRSNEAHNKRAISLLRVFAFNLLDSAHRKQSKTSANCVRLLKVVFKAAKSCLDASEVELAVKALERAATFVEELGNDNNDLTLEDQPVRLRLAAEYYILRTTLVHFDTHSFPCHHH